MPLGLQVLGAQLPTLPDDSRQINVPVMIAVGSQGKLFCGYLVDCDTAASVRAAEARNYSSAAALQTYVLPGGGHDISLANNAADFYAAATSWVDQQFGNGLSGQRRTHTQRRQPPRRNRS